MTNKALGKNTGQIYIQLALIISISLLLLALISRPALRQHYQSRLIDFNHVAGVIATQLETKPLSEVQRLFEDAVVFTVNENDTLPLELKDIDEQLNWSAYGQAIALQMKYLKEGWSYFPEAKIWPWAKPSYVIRYLPVKGQQLIVGVANRFREFQPGLLYFTIQKHYISLILVLLAFLVLRSGFLGTVKNLVIKGNVLAKGAKSASKHREEKPKVKVSASDIMRPGAQANSLMDHDANEALMQFIVDENDLPASETKKEDNSSEFIEEATGKLPPKITKEEVEKTFIDEDNIKDLKEKDEHN